MAQCLAVGVLACGSVALAPSAEAGSTTVTDGRLWTPAVVVSTDSCVDVPVNWDLPTVPEDHSWTINLNEGASVGVFLSGDGPTSGHDAATWCQAELPGAHQLTGEMKVWDADYNLVTDEDVAVDYKIQKMVTRATIRAGRTKPRAKQSFSLKGCITAHRKRQDYRDFTLQYHWKGGPWHKLVSSYTDEVGCYMQSTNIPSAGTVYFRARVPGDGISTTAYSPAVKVVAHK